MPRPKDLPCCTCGAMMVRFSHSLPSGQAKCQPCRNIERPPRIRPHCMDCGTRMNTATTAENAAVARCMPCRQANQKNLHACTDCGVEKYYPSILANTATYRCHPCRRLRPAPGRSHVYECEQCGVSFTRKKGGGKHRFCTIRCSALAQTIRHPDHSHVKRGQRESNAPGLVKSKRTKLLHQWMRQQTTCVYCDKAANTIDHVVPLVRGGTNYEGNLAPACKSCNSSKSGYLIIEWRSGLRLPPMWTTAMHPTTRTCKGCEQTFQPKSSAHAYCTPTCNPRAANARKDKPPHDCPICQTATTRPVYCSRECSVERTRRDIRDRYRAAHGLPVDRNQPVNKRATQPTFSLLSG